MLRQAHDIPRDTLLERDVCIVGAGAAGITLARELRGTNRSVCLLESGGLSGDPQTQDLYAGQTSGGFIGGRPGYPLRSRLRFFGGSTNHWAGICRHLDPIDFEARSWIPNSGWPFDRSVLEPFYTRAAALLSVRPFSYGAPDRAGGSDGSPAFDADVGIEDRVYHLSPAVRFGERYRADLADAPNVEVLLHANAINLQSDPEERHIEHVDVAGLEGQRFRVRARTYVLAAGGLENPRLLLASNRVRSAGLGNAHDVVGRYFMDHVFHLRDPGEAVFAESEHGLTLYEVSSRDVLSQRRYALFGLSPELQRRHRVANHGYGRLTFRREPSSLERGVGSLTAEIAALAGARGDAQTGAWVGISSELVPDPDNRVTLTSERDALGMPRLRLHWRLAEEDERGLERGFRAFAAEAGRSLRARVRVKLTPRYRWRRLQVAQHHIGTTRMHDDPKRGVVDPQCRVHGIDNLYVAGSSVFPTCGQSNPTFTIVALTLRLSEHLKERPGS